MEFDFSTDIIYSPVAQALTGAGLVAAIYLIFVYRMMIVKVLRHCRRSSRLADDGPKKTDTGAVGDCVLQGQRPRSRADAARGAGSEPRRAV